jgi:hypothetical protein
LQWFKTTARVETPPKPLAGFKTTARVETPPKPLAGFKTTARVEKFAFSIKIRTFAPFFKEVIRYGQ